MKSIHSKLALLSLAATLALAACNKDKEKTPGPGDPDTVEFTDAMALYWDDVTGNGTGMFNLYMWKGITIDPTEIIPHGGPGNVVSVELYTPYPENGDPVLPAGHYALAADPANPGTFTFTAGNPQEDQGSFYGSVDASSNLTERPITGGKLTIDYENYQYAITGEFDVEGSTEKLVCKYKGDIAIYDAMNPEPEMPGEFDGTFRYATAGYEGDYYGAGVGNLYLSLLDAADPDALPYHRLSLDINVPLTDDPENLTLAAGTYQVAREGVYTDPFTYNPGHVTEEGYEGSCWIIHDSQQGEHPTAVSGGTLTVAKSGSTYTLTVGVTLADGTRIDGTYQGEIEMYDNATLSLLDHDVALDDLASGKMDFYGTLAFYPNPNYNWVITLTNASGQGVIFDFMTAPGSLTKPAAGTYNPMPEIKNEYLLPFNYIPGHLSGSGNLVGCWYTEDEKGIAPLVDGKLEIAENAGNYTVTFDMKDDYSYGDGPHSVAGNFSGPLQYTDLSEGWNAPRLSPARPERAGARFVH